MVWQPDGGKSLSTCLTVSTEYRRVTDRQTDGQMDISLQQCPRYAYVSRDKNSNLQQAQQSQRDRAMLRVIEYFAKLLKIIRSDTRE